MQIDTNGFELGDKVRDPITGVEGPIIAFTQWMTGCARATISRGIGSDGKMLDGHGVDVLVLELVQKNAVAVKHNTKSAAATKGGPSPEPPSQR